MQPQKVTNAVSAYEKTNLFRHVLDRVPCALQCLRHKEEPSAGNENFVDADVAAEFLGVDKLRHGSALIRDNADASASAGGADQGRAEERRAWRVGAVRSARKRSPQWFSRELQRTHDQMFWPATA
jgi:hypothetical protein